MIQGREGGKRERGREGGSMCQLLWRMYTFQEFNIGGWENSFLVSQVTLVPIVINLLCHSNHISL